MIYLTKTPKFIQRLLPAYTWTVTDESKSIFLTFDDGPVQGVTPWVLDVLSQYNAKATFFCVGENVVRNPLIYRNIIHQGHSIGSHTNNHLSGWSSDNASYFKNVRRGATLVKSSLFRPPYGRLKPSQSYFLTRHYNVVMWDVLSGDFDPRIDAQSCLQNVLQYTESGSIVVMHDSLKSEHKLRYVLPRFLAHFSEKGYVFKPITEDILAEKSPVLSRA